MIIPPQTATEAGSASGSTGPKTEEGKQRSHLHAIKHGLSGDAMTFARLRSEAFESRREAWRDVYKPQANHEEWLHVILNAESPRIDRRKALAVETASEIAQRASET